MRVGLCLMAYNSSCFLLLLTEIYFDRCWMLFDSTGSNWHLPTWEGLEERTSIDRAYMYQAVCWLQGTLEAEMHPYFADEEMELILNDLLKWWALNIHSVPPSFNSMLYSVAFFCLSRRHSNLNLSEKIICQITTLLPWILCLWPYSYPLLLDVFINWFLVISLVQSETRTFILTLRFHCAGLRWFLDALSLASVS